MMRDFLRQSLGASALLGACLAVHCDNPGLTKQLDLGASDAAPAVSDFTLGLAVPLPSGLTSGTGPTASYVDKGELPPDTQVRMMIGFPLRRQAALESFLRELYNPHSPQFRHYLSASQFMATYGPDPRDPGKVETWLRSQGLTIPFKATNHLLIQANGTATQFNQALGITLHAYDSAGSSSNIYYGTPSAAHAPKEVADRIGALLIALPAVVTTALVPDRGVPTKSPPTMGNDLSTIRQAYKLGDLPGFTGQGIKIGIVAGGAVRMSDAQSFWQGQGISRNDPSLRYPLELPSSYNEEATLDTQWAGGLAPAAEVILYQGPDALDASVMYLFNEAIGAGQVQVVTTSFSHNERFRHPLLRLQHNFAAMMAAALGITVVAASGDSAIVDVPATCPYVTAVGGTSLQGTQEDAWSASGSGNSTSFVRPWYQDGLAAVIKEPLRGTVDVSVNAVQMAYLFAGKWLADDGTSFATPAFAGMVAVIDSARAARALPPAGFLNSIIYTNPAVQQTFRDITAGGTTQYQTLAGWDYPTGWGSPNVAKLANQLP